MSYDLFFTFPQPVSKMEVETYFLGRPNFQCNGAAVYENADTGVYFSFNFETDDSVQARRLRVAFNLNYFRPHIFGLEAEAEVRAFIERFQASVEDPQMHGMGQGPYSTEKFFSGWNAGNAFGYQAITAQNKGPHLACPEAKMEAAWRWNSAKRVMQQKFADTLFVPTVMFGTVDGQLHSLVVWGDGIPMLMPQTDLVIIVRDQLAPKPFFGQRSKDMCLLRPDELDGLLGQFSEMGYPRPTRLIEHIEPSREITKFIGKLSPFKGQLKVVPVHTVLSQELLGRCGA